MKIALCLNHFLPNKVAGTEIYCFALATALQKIGVEVLVIIPNDGFALTERYSYQHIRVVKYGEPSVKNRALLMGKIAPIGLPNFLQVLDEEKPDIINFQEISGSVGFSAFHVKATRLKGYKIVITFHLAGNTCAAGTLYYKNKKACDGKIRVQKCSDCINAIRYGNTFSKLMAPINNLLYYLGLNTTKMDHTIGTALGTVFVIKNLQEKFDSIVNNSDRLVVLTEWYKKIICLNNVDPSKVSIIKQALPVEQSMITSGHSLNKFPLKIIFIGRISVYKGLHLLLEALRRLKGNICLDIYGQIEDEDYYHQCLSLSNILPAVTWKGVLPKEQVVNCMQNYHFLCLPSTFSEMSPLVVQEAFAAGIPVLASDVYGNAEQIIEGKNGWLFKFNDAEDLALKLEMLINQPSLVDTAKKHIPLVNIFKNVAREYSKLYHDLLKPI